MDAKISGKKYDEKQDIFIVSGYFPQIVISYKGEDHFIMEKSGRHHFNQVIKVSINNNETLQHMSLDMMH